MDVGSDTFPRDEVTGLAAFDHLDPVSTVSTLNVVPEVPAPAPRIFTPPPPPPMRASVTVPPPAARVSRTFSRPPEAPVGARASLPPAPPVPAELRADTTEVIDIPMTTTAGSFESWEDADDAATRVVTMADGSLAPSTALQMDWDEEEPPTQMRGEGGVSQPKPVVDVDWGDESVQTYAQVPAAIGYTPAPVSGRPSPFPSARPSAPVMHTPSVRPGAPSPFVSSEVDTAWGQDLQTDRKPLWLIGAGAVAIVALAFIARALLADPTPGLVTLATTPSDARVVINGQPVAGTSSPYSAPDLKPGVVHELVVRKPGYAEYRTLFTLEEGEAKTLPAVTLEAEPGEAAAMAAAPVTAAAAAVPAQPAAATAAVEAVQPAKV
jgi:PEGA domain